MDKSNDEEFNKDFWYGWAAGMVGSVIAQVLMMLVE